MATVDAPVQRVTKAPAKPAGASHKKGRMAGVGSVLILTVLCAALVHTVFCMGISGAASNIKWHTPGMSAAVEFGEADHVAKFDLDALTSFLPMDFFIGFVLASAVGFMLRLPFFRGRVYRTVRHVKDRLAMQLSASPDEVESILRNSSESNKAFFAHRQDLNVEEVEHEIESIKAAQSYLDGKGGLFSFGKGLGAYMKYHFVEKYANQVQSFAYFGAAFLIIVIGIRGLKFIPATKPSLIIGALGLEFSLLSLLAISLFFTEEEERTDRILKQVVDAIKGGPKGAKALQAEERPMPVLSRGEYEQIVREQMDKKILDLMRDKDDDALRRIALDLVAKG